MPQRVGLGSFETCGRAIHVGPIVVDAAVSIADDGTVAEVELQEATSIAATGSVTLVFDVLEVAVGRVVAASCNNIIPTLNRAQHVPVAA